MTFDTIFQRLRFRNLAIKKRIVRSNVAGRCGRYDGLGNQARMTWDTMLARYVVGAPHVATGNAIPHPCSPIAHARRTLDELLSTAVPADRNRRIFHNPLLRRIFDCATVSIVRPLIANNDMVRYRACPSPPPGQRRPTANAKH
jgi:hypothetical protein